MGEANPAYLELVTLSQKLDEVTNKLLKEFKGGRYNLQDTHIPAISSLRDELTTLQPRQRELFFKTLDLDLKKGVFDLLEMEELAHYFYDPKVCALIAESSSKMPFFEAIFKLLPSQAALDRFLRFADILPSMLDQQSAAVVIAKMRDLFSWADLNEVTFISEYYTTLCRFFRLECLAQAERNILLEILVSHRDSLFVADPALELQACYLSFARQPRSQKVPPEIFDMNSPLYFIKAFNPDLLRAQALERNVDWRVVEILLDSWEGDAYSLLESASSLSAEAALELD